MIRDILLISSKLFNWKYYRLDYNGDVFKKWKFYIHDLNPMLPLWHNVPMFKEVFRTRYSKFKSTIKELVQSIEEKIASRNIKTDDDNFFDMLKFQRDKLVERNLSLRQELNDANLARLVHDLIVAAIETSANTFAWMLLLMKCNPTIESRLREEVTNILGDRNPTLKDRNQCHYVMAFLSETLRFRNITTVAVPHQCVLEYKHGNFNFQDSCAYSNLTNIHTL